MIIASTKILKNNADNNNIMQVRYAQRSPEKAKLLCTEKEYIILINHRDASGSVVYFRHFVRTAHYYS